MKMTNIIYFHILDDILCFIINIIIINLFYKEHFFILKLYFSYYYLIYLRNNY